MYKRSDGRYVETLYENGRRVYIYGHSKGEIKHKLLDHKKVVGSADHFERVAEEWSEMHFPTLAHSTLKGYVPAMNRAVATFKSEKISMITPQMINKFIIDFSRGHADKTVRTQLLVLNLIFNYAVSVGYVDINPCSSVTIPKGLPKSKVTMPSMKDINIIKNSWDDSDYGKLAFMALYLGCRRAELFALTWEDINMKNRTVTINKSLEYLSFNKPHVKQPKTAAGVRIIPIFDALYEKLLSWQHEPGIVFKGSTPEGYMGVMEFHYGWKAFQERTGISCTPHQLRHAYATLLYEHQDQIPIKLASQMLGHRQISTTADIYAEIRKAYADDRFRSLRDIDF